MVEEEYLKGISVQHLLGRMVAQEKIIRELLHLLPESELASLSLNIDAYTESVRLRANENASDVRADFADGFTQCGAHFQAVIKPYLERF